MDWINAPDNGNIISDAMLSGCGTAQRDCLEFVCSSKQPPTCSGECPNKFCFIKYG